MPPRLTPSSRGRPVLVAEDVLPIIKDLVWLIPVFLEFLANLVFSVISAHSISNAILLSGLETLVFEKPG